MWSDNESEKILARPKMMSLMGATDPTAAFQTGRWNYGEDNVSQHSSLCQPCYQRAGVTDQTTAYHKPLLSEGTDEEEVDSSKYTGYSSDKN